MFDIHSFADDNKFTLLNCRILWEIVFLYDTINVKYFMGGIYYGIN